jgi:hypothetical protein
MPDPCRKTSSGNIFAVSSVEPGTGYRVGTGFNIKHDSNLGRSDMAYPMMAAVGYTRAMFMPGRE